MDVILAHHERLRNPHLLPGASTGEHALPGCGTRTRPVYKKSPYMQINPAKVREALARSGMSQAELSRRLRWSEAKVSRYVHGNLGEVTLTNLSKLAAALGVSAAALVDLEDVAQNDVERALLRNFRAATDRDRLLAQAQVEPRKLLEPPSK